MREIYYKFIVLLLGLTIIVTPALSQNRKLINELLRELRQESSNCKILSSKIPIDEQLNRSNCIYIIYNSIDLLGQSITIPDNSTLKFIGGTFSNGTINLNNCKISNDGTQIFNNVMLEGKILNTTFDVSWCGILPDKPSIDATPLLKKVEHINAPFEFSVGNYYFSEFYTAQDNFTIEGKSTNLCSKTIFLPYTSGQRYLIKLGGGKDSFGQSNERIHQASIIGVTFRGDPKKRMVNILDGVYNAGYLVADCVEVGTFAINGNQIYDLPLMFAGYIYECVFEYVQLYGNHTKSDCPVIYFGAEGGNRYISATQIKQIMTEVICGPIMKSKEGSSISELVIGEMFHEGSHNWESVNLYDLSEYKIDHDKAIVDYESCTKVPLIELSDANVLINSITMGRLSFKWKNNADLNDGYNVNSFINIPSFCSTLNLSIGHVFATSAPYLYITNESTAKTYKKSIQIAYLSASSGSSSDRKNYIESPFYKYETICSNSSVDVHVQNNSCVVLPYVQLSCIDGSTFMPTCFVKNIGTGNLTTNTQSVFNNVVNAEGDKQILTCLSSAHYIVPQSLYFPYDVVAEIRMMCGCDGQQSIGIEYYDVKTHQLVKEDFVTINCRKDTWVTQSFCIKKINSTYFKLTRKTEGYTYYIDYMHFDK